MSEKQLTEARISVFIAGDSTACDYEPAVAPRTGWGQVLNRFFDEEHVEIVNRAVSGRSSKSFINEGLLAKILADIKAGDYLLIQFGHNDPKKEDPHRYADPDAYQTYLAQYVNGARKAGANPVLITPVNRRKFENGKLIPTHGVYPEAMIKLARELQVPLIDLTERSRVLFEKLGPEETKRLFLWLKPGENGNYPEGIQDDTHFLETGALEVAKLIVAGIRELDLPLAKYLKM